MKFRPSKLTAAIFCILLLSVLTMCTNPIIVELIKPDLEESSPVDGPEPISVNSTSLNATTLPLLVRETETLTATVQPANATNHTVTWTSSDDFVATVSESGLVTAIAAGSAIITVTTVDGNHSASCTVTVRQSTGKADAPFLIWNELELRQVGTAGSWNYSAHYKLMADITLELGDWAPIGQTYKFTGSFNGNNKTITGMSINNKETNNQGMFQYIGAAGEVKNLTLLDCKIYGGRWVGGVAAYNDGGTITNCYVEGVVSGTGVNIGGVAGLNGGTVENCYFNGDVSGTERVGGVTGTNNGIVENCYATGNISGNKQVGGLVGGNLGTVYNCNTASNVDGTGNDVGGVAGYNYEGTVENCYAMGIVSGNNYVGGVVGDQDTGTIRNCVVLNPNINSGAPGRIVGYSYNGKMTNNYAHRDMKVNNGAKTWTNNISDRDGADITAADYHLESWWSSSAGFDFSATGAWAWHSASQLPILKGLGQQNLQ